MDVLYNYPGMMQCVTEMTQCHATAIALKETGIAHKESLRASWTGGSQMAFDDAHARFLAVNQKVEDATGRVIQALSHGTDNMQAGEMQMMHAF